MFIKSHIVSTNLFGNLTILRIVKLSSPNLNYLIISGAALLYISVYMYTFTIDQDQANFQTIICNVRR